MKLNCNEVKCNGNDENYELIRKYCSCFYFIYINNFSQLEMSGFFLFYTQN